MLQLHQHTLPGEAAVQQQQKRRFDVLLKCPLLDLDEGFQEEVVHRGEGPLPHHQGQALLPVFLSPLFHCRVWKTNAGSLAECRLLPW